MVKFEQARMVKIPSGVSVTASDGTVEISGKLGKTSRVFRSNYVRYEIADGEVKFYVSRKNKRVMSVLGTWASTLETLFRGVQQGFQYEMKIDYTHFPVRVSVKGNSVLIENFLGGRFPRTAPIVGNTSVSVKGDRVFLEGIDRQDIGETVANIERATKIRHFDLRVFQDGIYLLGGN
ncbi:MAG: 50S ribosomal protein L6 [Candidatus Thermoplasmatota archaeon]|jgi:large subunit ribosomal protein L6|nr:50S ribosomal protein L6 [Candidatus Thermoplasmatota archaeon]